MEGVYSKDPGRLLATLLCRDQLGRTWKLNNYVVSTLHAAVGCADGAGGGLAALRASRADGAGSHIL